MKWWHNFWLGVNARELMTIYLVSWCTMGVSLFFIQFHREGVLDLINYSGMALIGIIIYVSVMVKVCEDCYKFWKGKRK